MRGPLFTKMEQDRAGLQAMAVPRAHEMQRVEESRYSTTQVSDGGYTTVFETVSHDLLSISLDLGDALGLRRQSLRGMICCRTLLRTRRSCFARRENDPPRCNQSLYIGRFARGPTGITQHWALA